MEINQKDLKNIRIDQIWREKNLNNQHNSELKGNRK